MGTSNNLPKDKDTVKRLPSLKKLLFLIVLVGMLVSLIGLSAFAYLYYGQREDSKDLGNENSSLQDEIEELEEQQDTQVRDLLIQIEDLQATVAALEEDKVALQKSEADLKKSEASYKSKAAQARQYNDVLGALHDTIVRHNGFSGWTEAEYQTGRSLALATGDQGLVDAVDDAWHDLDGDPVLRVARVLKEIIDGIYANT